MELALQYNVAFDINPEAFDWHRKPEESAMQYIKRVS